MWKTIKENTPVLIRHLWNWKDVSSVFPLRYRLLIILQWPPGLHTFAAKEYMEEAAHQQVLTTLTESLFFPSNYLTGFCREHVLTEDTLVQYSSQTELYIKTRRKACYSLLLSKEWRASKCHREQQVHTDTRERSREAALLRSATWRHRQPTTTWVRRHWAYAVE